MKVYVVTKALPLEEEIYVSVHASMKAAEKAIRKDFPNARKDDGNTKVIVFWCVGPWSVEDVLFDEKRQFLMFIRVEDI